MKFKNAGPTYGGQKNINVSDIAFSIHDQVDAKFYDVLYPGYEFPNFIKPEQFERGINPGAAAYSYIVRDKRGSAAFVGNGPNDDIPLVAQSAGAVTVPLAYSAVGARVMKHDAEMYSFGFNANLADDLGKAMRKACDNLRETTWLFGAENLGFDSILNHPRVATVNAAVPWSSATAQQIVEDINHALTKIWEDSRTLFIPTAIFLPMEQFALIHNAPFMIAGSPVVYQNIAEYVKKNNIATTLTGSELEIYASRYLSDAGDAGATRMVVIDRNADNQAIPESIPYRLDPPIMVAMGMEWYADQKFGPYHVRQPGSMLYMDGI